jgi:hypothetical protein
MARWPELAFDPRLCGPGTLDWSVTPGDRVAEQIEEAA